MGFLFGALGVVVASIVLLASSASAATTVTPDHGVAGETYAFSSTGFKPGSKVLVIGPGSSTESTADGNGSVTANIATQRNTGVPGIYRVRAQGIDPQGNPVAPFAILTVTHCLDTPTPCPRPSSLPRTGGSDMPRQLIVGLGLIAAGAFFVTRKRIAGGHFVPYGAPRGHARRTLLAIAIGGSGLALIASGANAPEARAAGAGSITGQIIDAGGGAADICVRAYNANDYGVATTDSNGNYSITNLADGTYNVAPIDCNALPTRVQQIPQAVSVTGGVATKNFVLVDGAVVVAKAVRDADSTGIKFSCLMVKSSAEASGCFSMGPEGTFVTEPVHPASYVIGIRPGEGTFPTLYNGATEDPDANKVNLVGGQVFTGMSLRFKPAGTISGVVRDAVTGQAPTRRVCVVPLVNNRYLGAITASAFAETDGSFNFTHVGETPRKIAFSDCAESGSSGNAYKNQWYNARATLETADAFTVTPGAEKGNVDAAMTTADGPPPTVPPTTAPPTTATTAAPTVTTAPGTSSTTTPSSTSTPSTTSTTASTSTATTLPPSPPAAQGAATTNTESVAPGGSMTVSGGGFGPGTPVNVVVYSTPTKITTVNASATGTVAVTFTVPGGLARGSHTLQLQGVDASGGTRVLERQLTVVSQLPRTGGLPLRLDAVVAMLAIAALVLRRRVSLHAS
ncbi:MAG: LPXTG cell wall anchor domain-containing protein [Acidimicrobiales bacterium]|nr:LPXTG cell wall anchor domain-containing protein [Acidimicrobiales bacterium]